MVSSGERSSSSTFSTRGMGGSPQVVKNLKNAAANKFTIASGQIDGARWNAIGQKERDALINMYTPDEFKAAVGLTPAAASAQSGGDVAIPNNSGGTNSSNLDAAALLKTYQDALQGNNAMSAESRMNELKATYKLENENAAAEQARELQGLEKTTALTRQARANEKRMDQEFASATARSDRNAARQTYSGM